MPPPRPARALAVLAALLALGPAACGGGPASSGSAGGATARTGADAGAVGVRGDVVVFAAASLTESFTELGEVFEAANPAAAVVLNFASSSALVRQITEGAPADVFASADPVNMAELTATGGHGNEPATFAENELRIIVPPGNPAGISGLVDLARRDVLWVTCAPEVPVGAYTEEALRAAGVTATPASYEENVKAVVAKVTLGEADAGVVYATDVAAAGSAAEGVAIPPDQNVVARYPITTVAGAPNPEGAAAFVDLVLSDEGREVLRSFGFRAP